LFCISVLTHSQQSFTQPSRQHEIFDAWKSCKIDQKRHN
jgi:hypothetical protein